MSRAILISVVVLVTSACRSGLSPVVALELSTIEKAMASQTCTGTESITLRLGFSLAEHHFLDRCWTVLQSAIVPKALQEGSCSAVLHLPGVHPRTRPEAEQRFVYYCWMSAGLRDMDSCIGMSEIGDSTSLPYIRLVLKRTPPVRSKDGEVGLYDTSLACMDALRRVSGVGSSELLDEITLWGPGWAQWAAQERRLRGHQTMWPDEDRIEPDHRVPAAIEAPAG